MAEPTVSTSPAPGKVSESDTRRPAKPYPSFPLTAHPSGRWCKKHKGRQFYFGPLADWQGALQRYEREWPYVVTGRTPPTESDGLTVARLADHFYEAKRLRHTAGELALTSLCDYDETCKGVIAAFGRDRSVTDLDARDFGAMRAKLAERLGPVALGNEINRVRMVFNYGFKNGLIDRPVRFGSEFNRPSKKVLRLHRADKGPKLLTADEIRKLIAAADVQIKAMIYLGINSALGNKDVSDLNRTHLDLNAAWLNFPRQKTGIGRRCPLWPETVKAIRAALASRPLPTDPADADAVFVTMFGRRWVRGKSTNAVVNEFVKLLKANGMKRPGIGFYVLRHVHRTVSDEVRDHRAAGIIMGHESNDISGHYVEKVDDARLRRVTDHVRAWLFTKAVIAKPGPKARSKQERKAKPARATGGDGTPHLRLVG